MNDEDMNDDRSKQEDVTPHRIRIPGFIGEQEIGLGDAIKRATSAIGVRPCKPCANRAARLNGWVTFTGRSER